MGHVLKRVGSFLAPAAYVLAVLILFQFACVQVAIGFSKKPAAPPLEQTVETHTLVSSGLPVRLEIPRIGVNAIIRAVGLTSTGSMGTPKLPSDTAWYELGPKPGENGSAVIDGHVNWWNNVTGVFAHLNSLKPGDIITVDDDQGARVSFIVRATRTYGRKDDATDVFRSTDGKSHLNLITCDGIWDKLFKTYSKRLVVFADKTE